MLNIDAKAMIKLIAVLIGLAFCFEQLRLWWRKKEEKEDEE